ncbi:hypothetical protein [Rhodococcus sp. NPDC058514]|uniref:hypothetical protein n=1 Tax=unclassified Rhodococcus (in: high G+C Gram-positive bacteria) TaxID=192944 RepID=UPI00365E5879
MTGRVWLVRAVLAAPLLIGGMLGSAAVAAADHPESTDLGPVHTLGDVCYGQARIGIATGHHRPGNPQFGVSFARWTPTFGHPCSTTVRVNWRNLDTGAAGSVTVPITDNATWNQPPPSEFRDLATGSGRVVVTVRTDRPHLPPPPAQIWVP